MGLQPLLIVWIVQTWSLHVRSKCRLCYHLISLIKLIYSSGAFSMGLSAFKWDAPEWSTSLNCSTVLFTLFCTISFVLWRKPRFESRILPRNPSNYRDILLKRNLADLERVQVSNWEVPGVVNRDPLSGMKRFFRKHVCMLAGSLMLRKVSRGESSEMSVLLSLRV